MVEELPAASWYAEHIMQKPLYELCKIITVALGDGEVAQFERAWDPKTHDADAFELWRKMPLPRKLASEDTGGVIHGAVIGMPGKMELGLSRENERLAICRAVQAWWLAQQGETKA